MRKKINIKFQNGLNFETATEEILSELQDDYEFIDSDKPDFIVFGPYGNDVPVKGDYTRIGYFCENMKPDFSSCEWAFGIPRQEEINNEKYFRIQWHGLNPKQLVKNLTDNEIDQILDQKKNFCNFLYSNEVPFRERFFKELSKYKKIDAPGKSMNNMPNMDHGFQGTTWERKRGFLSSYKFTIAFENYVYPGYQTEKLYDPMQVNSLPIYLGDSYVTEVFNPKSFINALDYLDLKKNTLISFIEKHAQQDFVDLRPHIYRKPNHHLSRKVKKMGRFLKMDLQLGKAGFTALIDQIINIDQNQELYIQYLKQPWFHHNQIPTYTSSKMQWNRIFDGNNA